MQAASLRPLIRPLPRTFFPLECGENEREAYVHTKESCCTVVSSLAVSLRQAVSSQVHDSQITVMQNASASPEEVDECEPGGGTDAQLQLEDRSECSDSAPAPPRPPRVVAGTVI